MILGTAGHIDHGKTALVHALTGIWTDRLKEERERGISIDVGFAHCDVAPGLRVGIVDVPGHEDFVRNMVAGASGIDAALFVVSAEEGMMPQSREHLEILCQLGVDRGIVALTKRDLVDAEWLDLVSAAVGEELAGTFLEAAPRLAVSVRTGEGLPALQAALRELARMARAAPPAGAAALPFRLPVDRAFTVRGVGTVVTGTPRSGRLELDDAVRVLPGDHAARVRSIESHGEVAAVAVPGRRAAVALGGVERAWIRRGSVVAKGEHWRAARLFEARVRFRPARPRELRSGARVRVLLGTAEAVGRLVLEEDASPLRAGGRAFAQLRLESDLVAAWGDRFVLRAFSPVETLGGGTILWRSARRLGPRRLAAAAALHGGLESEDPGERLRAVLREVDSRGATAAEAAFRAGLGSAAAEAVLRALQEHRAAVLEGGRWYSAEALQAARARALRELEAFHGRDRVRRGMPLGELRERVGAPPPLFERALEDLRGAGEAAVEGAHVRLPSRGGELGPRESVWRDALLGLYERSGLEPPDAAAGLAAVGVPEREGRLLLERLAQEGGLTKVATDFYFHAAALRDARERVRALLAGRPAASVGELKDLLGLSRKYLIPLLEHFDREGVTRRTPAGRSLARP